MGELTFINVGAFTISEMDNGKIWIRHEDGESGEFSEHDLAAVIGEFFWDNF